MLRVFYGKATELVCDAAQACVQQYEAEGYTVARLDADRFSAGAVVNAVESVSLFGTPTVFVLDNPSSDADFWQEVQTHAGLLADAATPFVLIDGPLTAAQKRVFNTATEMHESTAPAGERFNTFALAEALATRNKKALWVGLQAAYRDGQELAAVIGILWWQLKMIRLAQSTASAEEAGVKSFPYQKAKRAKFTTAELAQLQFSLLQLYHQARRGGRSGENALETWILRL